MLFRQKYLMLPFIFDNAIGLQKILIRHDIAALQNGIISEAHRAWLVCLLQNIYIFIITTSIMWFLFILWHDTK